MLKLSSVVIVSVFQTLFVNVLFVCIVYGDFSYNETTYDGRDLLYSKLSDSDFTLCLTRFIKSWNSGTEFTDCCLTRMCPLERISIIENLQARKRVETICDDHVLFTKVSDACRDPRPVQKSSDNLYNIILNPLRTLAQTHPNTTNLVNATTAISISSEQLKVKEPTKDNLTRRTTQNSELPFLDIPRGDDLKIHELQLENEFLTFEAFSSLMGYLLPSEFPIDVIRDAFKNRQSSLLWIFQVMKLEILVVVWIIVWAILSLCLPMGVMASFCFPTNIRRLNEEFANDSLDGLGRRTENTLGCLLHVLLILMLCPVILILASNEQISRAISKAPESASIIYEDISTFIRNSHMQISFVTTTSTDITVEAIRKDLEDIDSYLGVPYQQQISAETGLDLALVALEDLKEKTSRIALLVADLLTDCELARKAGKALHDEIQEIARQLLAIKQQCSAKDRPLCFTIQFSGFDIPSPLINLTNDPNIQQLNRMHKDESFNSSIELARKSYSAIPNQVVQDSIPYISDIKELLSRKRTDVYKSTHDLDILARTLSQEVNASQEAILTLLGNVVKWDLWRWLAILGTAALVALIWRFLICGAPCGCRVTSKSVPLLISGISISCIVSIIVWALGTASFLLGAHGRSLICQPLYDHPHYEVLSEFMDAGGLLYGQSGFFKEFSNTNYSVKVATILKGCQRDQSAYHTFHLQNKLDLEKHLNYRTWNNLSVIFDHYATATSRVEILSPGLQLNLQILSSNTATNFTNYRQQMSMSITRRDLGSFADQMNTVARQLADPVVSRKVDTLAFSVRRVVQNEMQRLNDLRGQILYKITTLEVLLPPLNRQVNQSLSHLKTIQFFLDNQGWQISERARRQFIARIENYLQNLYDHATRKVTKEIGKCRPLWEMFHVTRFHVCKLIFDPLNAIAFGSYFLIFVFLATTPIVVKLIDFYNEAHDDSLFTSHRDSREVLVGEDEPVWTSPSTESPEAHELTTNVPSIWVSPPPRPPTVSSRVPMPRVPHPPAGPYNKSSTSRSRGKLSSFASRITGARGHESLKLIEPIHWKSGSTTPRSWI